MIEDFAIIRKMFVAREFRGNNHGVAKELLTILEKDVGARKIAKIYLGTVDALKAAHRFYEKNDYRLITDLPSTFPVMKIDTKFYCKKYHCCKSYSN